jgi:hypothetical protein
MTIFIRLILSRVGLYVVAALAVVSGLLWADQAIRNNERNKIETLALRQAITRVQTMEKNNANFRTLSERDRCLALALDSGLPNSACD